MLGIDVAEHLFGFTLSYPLLGKPLHVLLKYLITVVTRGEGESGRILELTLEAVFDGLNVLFRMDGHVLVIGKQFVVHELIFNA